jgi:hypothetical protein
MATEEKEEFKFPDEIEDKEPEVKVEVEEDEGKLEVEIVDDTPEEDRNVEPLTPDVVNELEQVDESEEYSKNVKTKFKQYKKAWHDERRAKEAAYKEQQEALAVAQAILEENKRLKNVLHLGEKELIVNYQANAELELEKAKKAYKEAYDSGDSDKVLEAQQEIVNANLKLDKAKNFKPTTENFEESEQNYVQQRQNMQPQRPAQMDDKAAKWVSENPWYVDSSKARLRNYAMSYHNELAQQYGLAFIGTDEYYNKINQEMRRRFPDELGLDVSQNESKTQQKSKSSTVVASAKRSTSSKKVVLSKTQVALAKKLGLTPEQYAIAQSKLES